MARTCIPPAWPRKGGEEERKGGEEERKGGEEERKGGKEERKAAVSLIDSTNIHFNKEVVV